MTGDILAGTHFYHERFTVILYEGPSLLDPTVLIVVIATEDSNPKTGRMLYTWILRQDRPPEVAAYDGSDAAICGDCKFRALDLKFSAEELGRTEEERAAFVKKTRTCYVRLSPAEGADEETPPSEVWRKWKAGDFYGGPQIVGGVRSMDGGQSWTQQLEGTTYWQYRGPLPVRIGSYGDPAAVPTRVWAELVRYAKNWTGYTHFYKTCDPELKRYCMASVDTPEERAGAQKLGWRTFFVVPAEDRRQAASTCPDCGVWVTVSRHSTLCDRCAMKEQILCPATDPDPKRGKACPKCKGNGFLPGWHSGEADPPCHECNGTGRVSTTCAVCGLCRGTAARAPSIWEVVHGKNRENHQWT